MGDLVHTDWCPGGDHDDSCYMAWRAATGRCVADPDCDGDRDHDGPHFVWVME